MLTFNNGDPAPDDKAFATIMFVINEFYVFTVSHPIANYGTEIVRTTIINY